MTRFDITLELSDSFAQQAKEAGLLEAGAIEKLLRAAMRKRAAGELFQAMDELAALSLPPMSEEEIQAEIDAVRREQARS
jgi:hypothetical protein